MQSTVQIKIRDQIAVVTMDNPPVNALSHKLRIALFHTLEKIDEEQAIKAIVLCGEGAIFTAGADIREFDQDQGRPNLNELINKIENLNKPVVAAIHGSALGGGLELALGCHFRCVAVNATLGFPEVKLGLIPGAGGTQRTPRLMKVKEALDLMTTGEPIPAVKAHEHGLVDDVVSEDLLDHSLAVAARLGSSGENLRRSRDLPVRSENQENFFENYRKSIAKRTRDQIASVKVIECVQSTERVRFEDGLDIEKRCFAECLRSAQSAALRHVFFAEREARRINGVDPSVGARAVEGIGIVGAGTMGRSIALAFLNAGFSIQLNDLDAAVLEDASNWITAQVGREVEKGRLSRCESERRLSSFAEASSLDALTGCDLVVEAVFEDLDVKRTLLTKLDRMTAPNAILASNTSTLDIDLLAAVTERPDKVLGMHFFSPAHRMRLVELVRGGLTSPETLASASTLVRKIGKVGVIARVCYGFIGNRMLDGYIREANFMLLEGASADQIDQEMVNFGMPIGPHAMQDLSGLDVDQHIRAERRRAGRLPDDPRIGAVYDRLIERGRLGQKTGAGVFCYERGSRVPIADSDVAEIARNEASNLGIPQRSFSGDEIRKRCLYPLINEGARVMIEGIAQRPGDIDIVWINGYGFPAYLGGPMFYADQVGLRTIRDGLLSFGKNLGDPFGYWHPAPLLDQLARRGLGFADAGTLS